jgi:hypothetical protein
VFSSLAHNYFYGVFAMAYILKLRTDKCSYVMRDGIGKDKKLKTINGDIFTYFDNEPPSVLEDPVYYEAIQVSSFQDAKEKILSLGHSYISDGLGNVIDLEKQTIKESIVIESKKIEAPSIIDAPIAVAQEQDVESIPAPQRQKTPTKKTRAKK